MATELYLINPDALTEAALSADRNSAPNTHGAPEAAQRLQRVMEASGSLTTSQSLEAVETVEEGGE